MTVRYTAGRYGAGNSQLSNASPLWNESWPNSKRDHRDGVWETPGSACKECSPTSQCLTIGFKRSRNIGGNRTSWMPWTRQNDALCSRHRHAHVASAFSLRRRAHWAIRGIAGMLRFGIHQRIPSLQNSQEFGCGKGFRILKNSATKEV